MYQMRSWLLAMRQLDRYSNLSVDNYFVEKVGNDLELSYSGYGAPSMLFKNIAISGE